jgi:DNA-binding MarR family transcriptional regulator
MRGTHICMAELPDPKAAAVPPAPDTADEPDAPDASDAFDTLDALDEVLVDVRRVLQRPGFRRRLLAAVGTPLELGTLRALRAVERLGPGTPCVGDVAELLAVDPSTASRAVDRAVTAGLLDRSPSDRDRRRTRLGLTAEGRAVLERVTAARRELLAEVTAEWPPSEIQRLTELLTSLRAGFDRLEDPA